jgi:general stress protein YciG
MIACESRGVVEQFLKIGGRRIYQNLQGKWVWRTIEGFTAKGLVRIRAKGGRVSGCGVRRCVMVRNSVGMNADDLAAHAAKLVAQAARYREIREELWAEAKACEGEIRRLEGLEAAGVRMQRQAPSTGWRGFGSMSPERRREIAAMGGHKAQALGRGHRFTPERARAAGKRCAELHPMTPERAIELGRKGGENQRPEHIENLWRLSMASRARGGK